MNIFQGPIIQRNRVGSSARKGHLSAYARRSHIRNDHNNLADTGLASPDSNAATLKLSAVDELGNVGDSAAGCKVVRRDVLLNDTDKLVRASECVSALSDVVTDAEVGKYEIKVGGNTGGASEISTALTFNGKDASGSRDYHTADFTAFPLLPSFTVGGTLPAASASNARALAWCSNETGGATVIYSDGTNWRRVYDNAVAS